VKLDYPGAKLAAAVLINATIVKMGEDVYVDATIQAETELDCSRCLEPYRWPLAARLQVLYVPDGSRHAREAADGTVTTYSEATIDLADAVRDLIAGELPRKPLCKPDCRGLCPRCGKPREEGPCGCVEPQTGYRPFKDLKLG
jgi:uncharacterized protein